MFGVEVITEAVVLSNKKEGGRRLQPFLLFFLVQGLLVS